MSMLRVAEIETEIQAILQVKLRRQLINTMVGIFYPQVVEAEIEAINEKFPISRFSKTFDPK